MSSSKRSCPSDHGDAEPGKQLKPTIEVKEEDEIISPIVPPNAEDDADLWELFEECMFVKKSLRKLKELRITTLSAVLKLRNELKAESVAALSKSDQKHLYQLCLWFDEFKKSHGNSSSLQEHFSPTQYEKFEDFVDQMDRQRLPPPAVGGVEALFTHARNMLHEGTPRDLGNLPEDKYKELLDFTAESVVKALPRELVQSCNFDVKDMIKKTAKAIINLPTGEPYPQIQLIAGRTQSGKSQVKAVVLATCDILQCPLLIMTKGVSESLDLSKKINRLLTQGNSYKNWWDAGRTNRLLVIPDTATRIAKYAIPWVQDFRKIKPNGKFIVIVDECDAFYRTEEGSQKMEIAFQDFMALAPSLRLEITATPIPALFALTDQHLNVEILELGISEDYSGVAQMVPLCGDNGEPLYLSKDYNDKLKYDRGVTYKKFPHGKLKQWDKQLLFPEEETNPKFDEMDSKQFFQCKNVKQIPFTDDNTMKLYEDALLEPGQKKEGVLLLDCTNNRVNAEHNIFQKAGCIQNHFLNKGKEVAIVVVVGGAIHVRKSGFLHGRKIPNSKTVSEVIERVDQIVGLGIPIFVFGYSKMRRCISYRSERRVPTHMILDLGLFQSNESYIQALGRATFNGIETVLKANGFSQVTVLTSENDLAMAQKYTNFVHEVSQRLKQGATVEEVMSEGEELFSDDANYFRHSNRKTGQIKSHKRFVPEQDMFEVGSVVTAPYNPEETASKILKAFLDLVLESGPQQAEKIPDTKNKKSDTNVAKRSSIDDYNHKDIKAFEQINRQGFTLGEIQGKYNSTYQDNSAHTIRRQVLLKELNSLNAAAKIEKVSDNKWKIKNLRVTMQALNHKF